MDLQELLLLCIAALAALAAMLWWRASTRASRAAHARAQHARAGEDAAEQLLESLGYEILDRQVSGCWELWVDGDPVPAAVRADLLVQKHGQRFVAEVKTGSLAPNPQYPPTRRQLLEYWIVFEPDGLLLVDMECEAVREVRFEIFE